MVNRVKININTSLVRTQAGFRKALKEYKKYNGFYDKYRGNFPKVYPSLVIFYTGYDGRYFITCRCIPVGKLKEYISTLENPEI